MAPRRLALVGGTTSPTDCAVALACLLNLRRLIRGPAIAAYERAFARWAGASYAYSFGSGRVGLYGLLRALNLGSGDEVLLQVPTHIVVPNAIRYVGAKPVYVDCDPRTFNMDLDLVERRITPSSKAIIIQHTFGIPADLERVLNLAAEYGLHVIEDCVHALGATYSGQLVGTFGKGSFFSTEETKTISTTMGGMVVTDDPELAAGLERFQVSCQWPTASLTARYLLKFILYYLLTEPHVHFYAQGLYGALGRRHPMPRPTAAEELRGLKPTEYARRLSNAQAVLGLRQLQRIDENVSRRRAVAAAYGRYLLERGFSVPRPPRKANPVYLRYPVSVRDRAATVQAAARHAMLGTWFTSVLEEAISPEYGEYVMGSCPRAEAAARHLVNLPTHPRVSAHDVEQILSSVVSVEIGER